MLGVALKSLTGSKRVLEILNRLGHTVSYHVAEEIETELTYESCNKTNITPKGMALSPDAGTGVAWDNYDCFVDTESGKDTLHDTVGIVYQTIIDDDSNQQNDNNLTTSVALATTVTNTSNKRRRSYQPTGMNITPYRKKPRLITTLLPNDDPVRAKYEKKETNLQFWKLDVLWMSCFVISQTTPMWVGWNSKIESVSIRTDQVQKVWYLPQINQSPTSNAVVIETMKRSQKLALEASRESIAVTYDLTIAKMALQLQYEETPQYDNIFVTLGSFHVELAFFSALGKLIAESGGPEILNESNTLAKGSLSGFIKGKNYKRCKRLHEVLALALEVLHFEGFLSTKENEMEIKNVIEKENNLQKATLSIETTEVFAEYENFCSSTVAGEHGKTAKFWFIYVNLIHLYHDYTRSIRTGNFEEYLRCLPKITNIFFALNHPNYARWLVKYYDNLLHLQETHPEVYSDFKKGWFAIKRTKRSFSANPIDLTLEQTINADLASQSFGISSMTNSIGARQRWAESHFIRSNIINEICNGLGINKKEDVSNHLRPSKISSDNSAVKCVKEMILETLNPFDNTTDQRYLFNLATGKSAPDDVEHFLLNFEKKGEEKRLKFINECIEDRERFQRPITRTKVNTFLTAINKKTANRNKQGKLDAACFLRDLFGSMLAYSVENKIDMAETLKFPLTPVPLSLSSPDGTMLHTPKSAILKHLDKMSKSTPPTVTNVTIVDAMFHFYLYGNHNLPDTFGGVAHSILRSLVYMDGASIHFVSDNYYTPSIKDAEHEARADGTDEVEFQIKGPSQKRPSNWLAALKNNSFKKSLIGFLIEYWQNDCFARLLCEKNIIANCGNKCYKFSLDCDGMVSKTVMEELYSSHEEADNRMFFHLNSILCPSNVVIRTSDTDCLIIALGTKHIFPDSLNLWLEVGLQSNNSLRYININELHSVLGEVLCKSLPGYHAFTGCDYTASFSRKGKIAPFKQLIKCKETQIAFAELNNIAVEEKTYFQIENYLCCVYGKQRINEINEVRTQIFFDKYKPKRKQDIISCARKLEGSMLPPCRNVLTQKIKRTQFITRMWMSAPFAHPPDENPTMFGWTLSACCYKIKWFEGDVTPCEIENFTQPTEINMENNEENEELLGFNDRSSSSDSSSDEDE